MTDPAVPHTDADGRPAAFVDWEFAAATARRITPAGPRVDAATARAAVTELRECARAAREPVAATARLEAPDGPDALVVDRGTWSAVNIETFRHVVDPVLHSALTAGGRPGPHPLAQSIGGKAAAGEVAALLSFMSTKVLGQYDIAPGRPADEARLLLVAPNIVDVERELDLEPADFRMWVCLHEETHRVQFTAVPWLRDHLSDVMSRMTADLAPTPDALAERLRAAVANLPGAVRAGGTGMAGLFLTPEQQAEVERITAVMSLLEGYADVVMDDVGPRIVPSVERIRARFDRRREGLGPVDVLIRRLMGLEAKMAQYRDGAAFVRAVQSRVGVDGFNAVWTSPQTLPTPDEIRDPDRWVARVHG